MTRASQQPRAKPLGGSRQPLTYSRTRWRARHTTLWPSPPGQPKVLVLFQGFSELLGAPRALLASLRMATALDVLLDRPLRIPVDRKL